MNYPDQPCEHDSRFLVKLRTALADIQDEAASDRDFLQIFAKADDQPLLERIASRNDLDYLGLVSSFQENSRALNLRVHLAETFEEAADCIVQIARTSQPEFTSARHIIQHMHPDLQKLHLWKLLEEEPINVHTTFPEDPEIREKTCESYIGITAADWGVAASATLVQITATGRPRSTSLVPSIHIGLLRKTRLLANLSEAYVMLGTKGANRSVTLISGPSKTADIEAHMVHGAHGPREMHVIIVG